ncbi:hypothetical protein [Planococcus donghaensis]|uniref:hypothetical protein n=1 Tax=Planococcus donghaensis TaxID=414778 RepID=UPI0037359A2F
MIKNTTTNKRILTMFKQAKQLLKKGENKKAVLLINEAEKELRESSVIFEIMHTPSTFHHPAIKAMGFRIYNKLYCVLYELRFNIQQGMKREALIKLDRIINTNIYADVIQAKLNLSDRKREISSKFKKDITNSGLSGTRNLVINLKEGVA